MKIIAQTQNTNPSTEEHNNNLSSWLHTELSTLTNKYTEPLPEDMTNEDINNAVEWLIENNIDMNKNHVTSLRDAIAKSKIDIAKKNYATNDVIYRFNDGWTIVRLTSDDLKSEQAIHHMLNNGWSNIDYDKNYIMDAVDSNKIIMYSIRDQSSTPMFTLQLTKEQNNKVLLVDMLDARVHYMASISKDILEKVKVLADLLRAQGYSVINTIDDYTSNDKIDDLSNKTEDQFGFSTQHSMIGGDEDYYLNSISRIEEVSTDYGQDLVYKSKAFGLFDILLNYAITSRQLNLLEKALETYQYNALERFNQWEINNYKELNNPMPDEKDFTIEANGETVPDQQGYELAYKKYEDNRDIMESEFGPYILMNHMYKKIQDAIQFQKSNDERIEQHMYNNNQRDITMPADKPDDIIESKNKNKTKIIKIAQYGDNKIIPSAEILATYVQSLKMHNKENELSITFKDQIDNLPSPHQIIKKLSKQEVNILYDTIAYLWKKLTKQDIMKEVAITNANETLEGNYWLLNNGMPLHGINHFGIIKNNSALICKLLDINGMTLQHYLSGKPNELIRFILKNGGVRLFINNKKELHAQCSSLVYGDWAKNKIKKYKFNKRAIKIIDFSKDYNGWESGVTILI